jgi:hypothetical protein
MSKVYVKLDNNKIYVKAFFNVKIKQLLDELGEYENHQDFVRSYSLDLKDNLISGLLALNVSVEEVKEFVFNPESLKIKTKVIENNIEMVIPYNVKLINKLKLLKAKFSGETKRWSISLDTLEYDEFREMMHKIGFEVENVVEFPLIKIKPLKVVLKRFNHLNEVQIESPYNKKVKFIILSY